MGRHHIVSMKLSPSEKGSPAETMLAEKPDYPYGLRISLENEAIEKLGLPALPAVGEKMMMSARVEVVGVSMRENSDGKKHRNIDLQIVDMGLYPNEEEKDTAQSLYGG